MRKVQLTALLALAVSLYAPSAQAVDAACQTKAELAADVIPPVGETQADEVLIFHALFRETGQEHPQWVVALFFKGCKQAAALVPSAQFKSMVGMGV